MIMHAGSTLYWDGQWKAACGKMTRDATRDPGRVTCESRGCQARVRKWRRAMQIVSTLDLPEAPP